MFEILRNKGAIYNEADDVLGKIARDIETDDKEVEMYELDDEIGGEGEDDLDLDDSELDEIDIHDVEDMSEFDIDAEEAHLDTDYINLEDFEYDDLEESLDFAKDQFKKYMIFNFSIKPVTDLVKYSEGLRKAVESDLSKVKTLNDIKFLKAKFAFCTNKLRKFVASKVSGEKTKDINAVIKELRMKIRKKEDELLAKSESLSFNLESMMMELEEIEARLESSDSYSEDLELDMFEEDLDLELNMFEEDVDLELDMFEEDVDLDFLFEENTMDDLESLHLESLIFELEDFEIDVDRGTEVITEFEDDDDDELLDDDDDDFLDL